MGNKDIISKKLLKRLALDIARILFELEVDDAEILETEYQTIEDRRADIVARMKGEGENFILHIEIQNGNDKTMPVRMLRYRADIMAHYPKEEIHQYLVYIGKKSLSMADHIHQKGLKYNYTIIDMHQVDCQTMIAQDTPDAIVLAVLCDFKGKPEREMLHFLLHRLQKLTADNEAKFREYITMMEILSTNRDLQQLLEEEKRMLSQIDIKTFPSYQLGAEEGMQQGVQQGMQQGMQQGVQRGMQQEAAQVLTRLLTRRFGELASPVQEQISQATEKELNHWIDKILDAET